MPSEKPQPRRPEPPLSQARLNPPPPVGTRQAANRANAQKSTGPRACKQMTAANAMEHGLRSARVLMPGEDPKVLAELREQLFSHTKPRGLAEQMLAERIVACAWRLMRLGRIEAEIMAYVYDQDSVGRIEQRAGRVPQPATRLGANVHYAATHGMSLKTLHRYEAQLERSFYAALHEFRQLQDARPADVLTEQTGVQE